jgi:hypothetical protein
MLQKYFKDVRSGKYKVTNCEKEVKSDDLRKNRDLPTIKAGSGDLFMDTG